jgi:hypothetical protein
LRSSASAEPGVSFLPAPLRESDPTLFRAGDRAFTRGQVLGAAAFRSDLDPLRETVRRGLVAQQYAGDEAFEIEVDDLQAHAERYRIDRDLSTAEDTERWLAENSLTIEDFTAWLERRAWRERFWPRIDAIARDYDTERDDVDALLWAEIVFGDHLAGLARALAVRVAALREQPEAVVFPTWSDELAAMEQAYEALRGDVLQPVNIARELDLRRSLLIRFEAQLAAFPSLDAAREAWLCVTRDAEALDAMARAAGAECHAVEQFLDEFPEPLRGHVLSAAVGEVLPPVQDADTFLVCRIAAKRLPETAEDPAVRARLEAALLDRAVDGLMHKHITITFGGG